MDMLKVLMKLNIMFQKMSGYGKSVDETKYVSFALSWSIAKTNATKYGRKSAVVSKERIWQWASVK